MWFAVMRSLRGEGSLKAMVVCASFVSCVLELGGGGGIMTSTVNGHLGVFDVEVIDVLDDYVMTEIHRGVYIVRRTTSTQWCYRKV